ncbi:DUF4336 domain-containing protein [Photobacterium nomapromontoriensis]|uniref:DUF4336 domain-containing protein n=1 Tax=Photobacterium nomapromontoriensis TaxID=2910237 RepID=UPI003D0FC658
MIEWHKDRLWYMDMPFKLNGIPVGARMTVIKLENGKLLIHSPIQLTAQLQLELTTLGTVYAVVTPNMNHHLFLSEWWLAYPNALFFAPPGLENKRTDLVFDNALSAKCPDLWRHQLYQTLLRGSDKMEEVIFCDPIANTLIVGDTLSWFSPTRNLFTFGLGIANGCYQSPAMPLYWRRTFNDKPRLRQSLQEILTWPFDRIILSHGHNIEHDGKARFYQAFKWAMK